ncbi:centromere protein C [Heliangelus exortis]|uniref:centromere protein C n=1 Tax=Heliangelus exortis TaxID=472823 RepID=UPI003A937066
MDKNKFFLTVFKSTPFPILKLLKTVSLLSSEEFLIYIYIYFIGYGNDLTINSPSTTCCSTPFIRSYQKASVQRLKAVKRDSRKSLPISPLEPDITKGSSHESPKKPAINNCVADSEKNKSPVCERKINNILKHVEALCKTPPMFSVCEDDHGSVGSPLVEELDDSVHVLLLDDQNTAPAAKSPVELENLEGPQTGRDEQVVLGQRTEQAPPSSLQREKSFSSVVLEAVATGALGKRYSVSTSPPSLPPLKNQDIEVESYCEFLIDESDSQPFNSWFSIPSKNKKSKKDGSTTPVPKPQPSGKEKTGSKKRKKTKMWGEALTKQKMDDLHVRLLDFSETSELDSVSDHERKILKSQRRSSTHMGKTKKEALKQCSPNQKKDTSWEPEAEELMLSWSDLETKPSDTQQHETMMKPNEDSPDLSAGHLQEQTVSQKKNLNSSRQSVSKTPQHLVTKKKLAQQKLPKDTVAKREVKSPRKKLKKSGKKSSNKRPRLQRLESSDSEPDKGLEREPGNSNEGFTSLLQQKLQTSVNHKMSKSEKPKNSLHTLESLGVANNRTPVKALQHLTGGVKNSERKQLSAKSSEKTPNKVNHRTSKGVCSDLEDSEPQVDSLITSQQDTARKKQKLPDAKIKSKKRKCNTQHGLQDSFAAQETRSHESGPVLEHCDKCASRRKYCEQNSVSSDNYEDLTRARDLFSNSMTRHKIVMPSNTPNVRRTKRIRLKPLEYWRGERVNYTMLPSGQLVMSEIVCPEMKPQRKLKQRKDGHKEKSHKTKGGIPEKLDDTLVDSSKPAVIVDVETNEEILLKCVNTESRHSCFFRDEAVEIYKNLNTSDFATGTLVLKPLKEKGYQFVHMDTIAFYVIHGKIIVTLHKTSYCLATGDFFYVPAGNVYNLYNLVNEESLLLFTQLKRCT